MGRGTAGIPSTPTTSPPTNPNVGAWQPAAGGNWTWVPGATPDPSVASQWGPGVLTNPIQAPNGELNQGAWIPAVAANAPSVTGGENDGQSTTQPVENSNTGWIWEWGATPTASEVAKFGTEKLTNPRQDPSGGPGVNTDPPPPDVTPPVVTDTWGGNAPVLTGDVEGFFPSSASSQGAPPSVQPFRVAPGTIRDQETAILKTNDAATSDNDDLVNFIAWAKQQNLGNAETMAQLGPVMDNLAEDYANYIALIGNFVSALNMTAQKYVLADKSSVMPPFPNVPPVAS